MRFCEVSKKVPFDVFGVDIKLTQNKQIRGLAAVGFGGVDEKGGVLGRRKRRCY